MNKKHKRSKRAGLGLPLKTNPLEGLPNILPLDKGNNYSLRYHRQNSPGMQAYYYLTQKDRA